MVEFNPFDLAVLEVGSGVWFLLSTSLAITFLSYAIIGARSTAEAYKDPTVQAAMALAVFSAGTALRGFLFWIEFTAIHSGVGGIEMHLWKDKWPWFVLSIALNVVGAAWAMAAFAPGKWRLIVTITTVVAAVLVPIWLFLSI